MTINYSVSIMQAEQFNCVLEYNIEKIYVPFDLFYWGLLDTKDIEKVHKKNKQIYLSLPRVIRKRDEMYLNSLKDMLMLGLVDGVLLKNIEEVGYINEISSDLASQYISVNGTVQGYTTLMVESDSQLYNWNVHALAFNKTFADKQTVPCELSIHEIKELNDRELIFPVYGRAALMVSANCVKKTTGNCMADCTHKSFEWRLNDRKNKQFLVYANCIHCYNEIFNSVPTSLHRQINDILKLGFKNLRIDFTDESVKQIKSVLDYYINDEKKGTFPITDYTTGHIGKGAI